MSSKDTCENTFGQTNCQSVGHALLNKMNESTEENCQQPQQLNRHPISHASLSECIGYNNDELKLKGFSIAHINIRSLVKNLDQLSMYLKPCQFDVLTTNETRLDSSIKDYEVGIVGYEIVRKDRNRNGGGVTIYVRNSINYKIRNDLQPEDLETITIEICKPKAK